MSQADRRELSTYIVEEIRGVSVVDRVECVTRAELFDHIQFLAEEESQWRVTVDGKPVNVTIEEV